MPNELECGSLNGVNGRNFVFSTFYESSQPGGKDAEPASNSEEVVYLCLQNESDEAKKIKIQSSMSFRFVNDIFLLSEDEISFMLK